MEYDWKVTAQPEDCEKSAVTYFSFDIFAFAQS